ncbi:MAG: O-antigen ligase family protein [Clostridia bacterium]|nr:O-antigen ligase family protein [Clostridia bacterium]
MEKTRKPILLPAILFSIYLLLFPIDSALGELIGTISVNNYIAIACLVLTIMLAMKRIIFKFDNFMIIYIVFFIYQFLIIINGSYFFTNRNVIFLFYNFMAIILVHVQWTEREKKLFKYMIVLGTILACYVVFTHINFDSSRRLYLSIGRNIDQNFLSANLIFGTALAANSMFKAKKFYTKLFFFVLLIWSQVCILYLGSRGGLLGNLAVVITVIWLNRKTFNVRVVLISVISLLLIFAAAFLFMPEWIAERFNPFNMVESGGSGRLVTWKNYLYYYASESLPVIVFGYGRGFIYDRTSFVSGKCTHNIFIKSLVEGGIIGFILHALLFVELLITVFKAKSRDMLAIIIGYIVCGMFLDLDDYRILPLMIILIMMYKDESFSMEYLIPKKKKLPHSDPAA